jgi:hypothetical protein
MCRDASRALAKMSFKPEDVNGDLEGLTYAETDVLNDWEAVSFLVSPHLVLARLFVSTSNGGCARLRAMMGTRECRFLRWGAGANVHVANTKSSGVASLILL